MIANGNQLPRVMGLGDLVLFYTIAVVGLRWVPTAATLGAQFDHTLDSVFCLLLSASSLHRL
jgi:hypothetical protein